MEQQPTSTLQLPESAAGPRAAADGATGAHGSLLVTPFVDTVEHGLDSKSRITLPAAMRPAFVDGGLLTLFKGPCVAVMTDAGFARWIAHLKAVLPTAGYADPAAHIRTAYAQASRFRPDVQGRFALADRLRHAAGIDREVTIVGAGARIELWNPATYGLDLPEWTENLAFHQDAFDLLPDDAA